jgi:hypothetical protein
MEILIWPLLGWLFTLAWFFKHDLIGRPGWLLMLLWVGGLCGPIALLNFVADAFMEEHQ